MHHRTLLDTPLRQPLTFLSAPRNPIPHQEIRPIDTPRVSFGSQRVGQGIMPLSRVPLQAIAGQPVTPQLLQRVSLAKQQASLPPLESLGTASSKRSLPLHQIQLPASRLKPFAPFAAPQATAKEFADNSTIPAHCFNETRLPLQGQQVELHPVSAAQQPVVTRTSRVAASHV